MELGKHGFNTVRPVELSRVYSQIQVPLAIRAYKEDHPDEEVRIDTPRENPKEIRDKAALEWNEKHSSQFETYARANPGLVVNMNSTGELDALYKAVCHPNEVEGSIIGEGALGDLDNRPGGIEI